MIEPFYVAFDPSTGVVVVRGELDEGTAHHVDALDLAGSRVSHIDCIATTFLGAGGITALLDLCKSRPTSMAASPAARRVIEICGLDHLFLMDVGNMRAAG